MMRLLPVILMFFSVSLFADNPATETVTEQVATPTSSVVGAFDLSYVPIHYPQYQWSGHTAQDTGYGIHGGAEWMPFGDVFGKLGLNLGVGFYAIPNVEFDGQFLTLTALPLELSLTYRLDYIENQIIVPVLKAGPGVTLAVQRGFSNTDVMSYWSMNYAAGLELCLNRIDRVSARHLLLDMGIRNTYILFEYVWVNYLTGSMQANLAHNEARMGFRFEF